MECGQCKGDEWAVQTVGISRSCKRRSSLSTLLAQFEHFMDLESQPTFVLVSLLIQIRSDAQQSVVARQTLRVSACKSQETHTEITRDTHTATLLFNCPYL